MTRYEYRVVPAPQRGLKAKGAKTTEARFAQALMALMNEFARDGWEYLRADTLPCEERVGLTGRTTRFQNMLVFRRALPDAEGADASARAEPVRALAAPPEEAAASGQARPPGGAEAPPAAAARLSVAERLAATLTTRTRDGAAPPLRAVGPEPGRAPRLGAARGQGLSRSDGGGLPAE